MHRAGAQGRAAKYENYDEIYAQCSGPGGLELAEFLAEKMALRAGSKVLDVGCNRGYQTCFLAKEYGVLAVGLDPWDDREQGNPMVDHLVQNAARWGVADRVIGLKQGVPDTCIASETFDFVYSTTALEMIRVSQGEGGYQAALEEIARLLKPGGVFGLGEPMHLEVAVPPDLLPYVSKGPYAWTDCFRGLSETKDAVQQAGFEILEHAYAPSAWDWWTSFAQHDPFCKNDPDGDPKTLAVDGGRWTSFGYVIARKPAAPR